MYFVLRVDLDYVPWDTPDANEFGHGEPAAFLRLLDIARYTGHRLQFVVSNRVLRAFPATAEAVLNEGHDLDWFCKHPESPNERFTDALELFSAIGHSPAGMAVRGPWPPEGTWPGAPLRYLSSAPGAVPDGVTHFPLETKPDREAARNGVSARNWTDAIKVAIRDAASRNRGLSATVRPQVLAKYDPKLSHVREILELASAVGLEVTSYRRLLP